MNATVGLELTRDTEELKRLFFSLHTSQDVANLLELPYGHLIHILYRAPHRYHYRTFHVAKKSGGTREISAPPASLAILQSKLNKVLQSAYARKPSAHGFVNGRSILSNALEHVGKRFVLNVDLADFFPSINFGRVRGMFMAKPYSLDASVATVLAQICCHGNQLPQGAPTSPIVSNMVCARLDGGLQGLAKKYRCTYTRYADDITFSTTRRTFPEQIADPRGGWSGGGLALGPELTDVIEANGFAVNQKKQRLQFRNWRQEVTGLTVNKFPNVPRRYVRQVRAMLHAWEKYGLEAADREFRDKWDLPRSRRPGSEAPSFSRVVRGKLDFLKMVKGERDQTYCRFANKLHELAPELMDEPPQQPPTDPDRLWQHWYRQYSRLVFQLVVRRGGQEFGGTAFAWRRRSLATAAHNLEGEVYVSPPFPEGERVPTSDLLLHPRGRDVDVAVIRLSKGVSPIRRHIPVRDELPDPGEQVAALGFASIPQRQPALAIYLGSVESRATNYQGTVDTLQVSIDIAGGMSGAPVIDRGGKLVGIVVEQSFEETQPNVPGRAFRHVLPVHYLREINFEESASEE